jgi:hypothetical protein
MGYNITTHLNFPKMGTGTSSTLINNIAQWLQIDAFTLLNGGAVMTLHARKIAQYFIILKEANLSLTKFLSIQDSKKTFILFILIKNKVAKQQLQTIK